MQTKIIPLHDRYLNFEEAREFLGNVPAATLRDWTSNRKIRSYRPGKRVLYRVSDIVAFVEGRARQGYY
jgi:excisionase family DNA binding protein